MSAQGRIETLIFRLNLSHAFERLARFHCISCSHMCLRQLAKEAGERETDLGVDNALEQRYRTTQYRDGRVGFVIRQKHLSSNSQRPRFDIGQAGSLVIGLEWVVGESPRVP